MTESSQMNPMNRRRLWHLAARLVVGAAILAFVFSRGASLARVAEIIREANPWRLVLALFIAVAGELLTAWKWSLLIRSIGGYLPMLPGVRASFIGMFYNNFLPGSVGGDIVRVLLIAKHAGGKARAMASTFMQRNTGLAGLFFIGIPASFLWPMRAQLPDGWTLPQGAEWLLDTRVWLLTAAAGYTMVNLALFSRRAYGGIWAFLHKLGGIEKTGGQTALLSPVAYLLGKMRRFHTELHEFRFWLAGPLALSAVTQLVDIFMVWNLARGLHLPVPLSMLLAAVPVVTLANLIPVTVNGIGLREAMYVALLTSAAAINPSQAVALSLMHFGVIITLSALGGLWQWKFSGEA